MSVATVSADVRPVIYVRRFDPMRDLAVVTPMWQAGFLEMAKDLHSNLRAGLTPTAALALAAAAAAYFNSPRTLALAATSIVAVSAALATDAVGGALLRGLLWRGILQQTAKDMTASTVGFWQQQGPECASEFFVAEASLSPGAPRSIVGCVAVMTRHTLYKESQAQARPSPPGEASVWRLSTLATARRLGVARVLMAAVEAWAGGRGCEHISLVTGNAASKAFYARMGYSIEDEAHARRVLFGTTMQPVGLLGWVKAAILPSRLGPNGTIFCKALPKQNFTISWLAGARPVDGDAGQAMRQAFDKLVVAGAAAAAGCPEPGAATALAEAVFLAGPASPALHRAHLLSLVPTVVPAAVDAHLPAMLEAAAELAVWRQRSVRAGTAARGPAERVA